MDPETAAAITEAEAITPAANSTFHRSRDAIQAARNAGACPEAEVSRLSKAVHRLESELAGALKLHPADREEFEDTLRRGRAIAALLPRLTPSRARHVRSQTQRLMSAASTGALQAGDLEDAVLLVLLALPRGAEYWNLVRAARASLAEAGGLPTELWEAVRFLAPDEVFGDGPSYPGAPRGAARATRVTGVTSAGLPGLGKKA